MLLSLLGISTVLISCGGEDNASPTNSAPGDHVQHKQAVAEFVRTELAMLENLDCHASNSSSACDTVIVDFATEARPARESRSEQVILIIDDQGLEFPAVSRYRSRVLQAVRLNNTTGLYEHYSPQVVMPRFVRDLFTHIDTFAGSDNQPTFIPAVWLRQLSQGVSNINSDFSDIYAVNHGDMPFLYLLEHNPEARFVIAQTPTFFTAFKAEFCAADSSALRAKIATAAAMFKDNVLDQYGVRYVSYSGGFSLATLRNRWTSLCQTLIPEASLPALLDALRPFYEVLFNTEGVMGFQASGINMSIEEYPLDTDVHFHNRVRVGDYTNLDSQLPEDGVIGHREPPALIASRQNSRRWIDLLINFGIEPVRPWQPNQTALAETNILGLDSYPITSIQPSWATPVALSQAIYIKNIQYPDDPLTDAVIIAIKDQLTPMGCTFYPEDEGRCKVQDPLLHRQQELFRLNYID